MGEQAQRVAEMKKAAATAADATAGPLQSRLADATPEQFAACRALGWTEQQCNERFKTPSGGTPEQYAACRALGWSDEQCKKKLG